jgi:hypothetical protein
VLSYALLTAPVAAAGVSVTPERLLPGQQAVVTFTVSNDRAPGAPPVVTVAIGLPPAVAPHGVEAKTGWTATVQPPVVTWRGGQIPPGQFATFALRVTAPRRSSVMNFGVRQTGRDGRGKAGFVRVLVTRSAAAVSARDSGARTLGKSALFVAIAAGALALGAGFAAMARWLRS